MNKNSEKGKQIKPVCRNCREKPCEGLYWKDCLVFPDISVVPFDCPLRIEDESEFCWELQSLSDYDVSRIAGDVWVRHNFGARYGNGKQDETVHLLSHFRQNKCIMIAKSADPRYKPWTIFGFRANSGGGFDLQQNPEKKEDEFLTGSPVDEAPAQLTAQSLLLHTRMKKQTKGTGEGMLGLLSVKKESRLLYWVAIKVVQYASMPMTRIQ